MNEFVNSFASNYWNFLLTFIRVSSLFLAFPFFSTAFIPASIRILLIFSFSLFFSSIVRGASINVSSWEVLAILVLKEIIIGFSFALVGRIFYAIVAYAAELISYLMGLTIANLFDPTFGMVSMLGRFFIFVFYGVFFATGGEVLFIKALYESFALMPLGSWPSLEKGIEFLLKEGKLIFFLGFKLAFPFVFALFITNLTLALVNRLIPQINVFIVGLPIQIFVGLIALFFGFPLAVRFMVNLVQRYFEDLFSLLRLMGGG